MGLLNSTYYRKCPMCGEITSIDVKNQEINKQIDEWEKGKI